MKVRLLFFIIMIFTLMAMLVTGCSSKQQAVADTTATTGKVELNVSAAVSLKDALEEVKREYEKKNPDVKVIYNLGASGNLQKQIEQGAPADIFISAALKQMNDLEEKNLLDKSTRKNFLENKLVVVIPKASNLNITKYEDLTKKEVAKISIGETTSVPAGQYAQEVLNKLGIWNAVKEKTVLAKDVRTVLTYVETENVEAGIVYKTDATASDKIKIVATAPEGSHQPIIYPLAILSGAKQKKAAEQFVTYLGSAESKSVFEKYGFSVIK